MYKINCILFFTSRSFYDFILLVSFRDDGLSLFLSFVRYLYMYIVHTHTHKCADWPESHPEQKFPLTSFSFYYRSKPKICLEYLTRFPLGSITYSNIWVLFMTATFNSHLFHLVTFN